MGCLGLVLFLKKNWSKTLEDSNSVIYVVVLEKLAAWLEVECGLFACQYGLLVTTVNKSLRLVLWLGQAVKS